MVGQLQNMKEEALIDQYFNQVDDGQLAIFCGAGISVNSGVPEVLGNGGLIPYLFSAIGLSPVEKDQILAKNLPFESIIETLVNAAPEITQNILFNVFDNSHLKAEPNHTHQLMAQMMYEGKVGSIMTTNFDTLIEQALDKIVEADPSFSYQVHNTMATQSSNYFGNCDWASKVPRLIKIHGCITRKEELVITISQIAKQKYQSIRRRLVREFFSKARGHQKIAIMGYSCSDSLDITPYLKNLKHSEKQLLYINHNGHGDRDELRKLKDVVDVRKTPAYRKTLATKRRNLLQKENIAEANRIASELLPRNPFRHLGANNHWWYANTDNLVKGLLKSGSNGRAPIEWKPIVSDWVTRVPSRDVLSAMLLELAEENALAFSYRSKVYRKYRQKNHSIDKVLALRNYASHLSRIGKNQEAATLLKKNILALERLEKGRLIQKPIDLTVLGIAYVNLGKYRQAERCYEQALKIYTAENNRVGLGDVYHNLGTLESGGVNHKKAVKYFRLAEKNYKIAGSMQGVLMVWASLGGALASTGLKAQARRYYAKARGLAEILSDQQVLSSLLNKEAFLFADQGKYRKAIALLKTSETIQEQLGSNAFLFYSRLYIREYYETIGERTDDGQSLMSEVYLKKAESFVSTSGAEKHRLDLELAHIEHLIARGSVQEALVRSRRIKTKRLAVADLEKYRRVLNIIVRIKRLLGYHLDLIVEISEVEALSETKGQPFGEIHRKILLEGDQNLVHNKSLARKKYFAFLKRALSSEVAVDIGIAYQKIAILLFQERKLKSAENYFRKAIEQYFLIDAKASWANTLIEYSELLQRKNDFQGALRKARKAYEIYEHLDCKTGMANALFSQAWYKHTLDGNSQEAIHLIETAQSMYQESGCLAKVAQLELTRSWHKLQVGEGDQVYQNLTDSRKHLINVKNHLRLGENHAFCADLIMDNKAEFAYHVRRAVTHFEAVHRQDMIANLYRSIGSNYSSKQDFSRAHQYFQMSIDILDIIRDERGKAEVQVSLGYSYYREGKYADARSALQQSLKVLEKGKGPVLIQIYWKLAELVVIVDGDLDLGLSYSQKALDMAYKSKDDYTTAIVLGNHGDYLSRKQAYYQANLYMSKSRKILRKLEEWSLWTRITIELVRLKSLQKLEIEAERLLDEIADWFEVDSDPSVAYKYHLHRAASCGYKKDMAGVHENLEHAVDFAQKSPVRSDHSFALLIGGRTYTSCDDHDKAEQYLTRCEEVMKENDLDVRDADLYLAKGSLHLARKQLREAKKDFRKCFFLFRKFGRKHDQCFVINRLVQICLLQKKFDQARSWIEKWVSLAINVDRSEEGYANYWWGILQHLLGDQAAATHYFNVAKSLFEHNETHKKVGFYLKTFDQMYVNRCNDRLGHHYPIDKQFHKKLKKYNIQEEKEFLFEIT